MHRVQSSGTGPMRGGVACALPAGDVAVACPTAIGASNAGNANQTNNDRKVIAESRTANCFLMTTSVSLQAFTFFDRFFTCGSNAHGYHCYNTDLTL